MLEDSPTLNLKKSLMHQQETNDQLTDIIIREIVKFINMVIVIKN